MTLEEYRAELRPSERPLFDEVVAIGIRKTIFALLDADVDDSVIQRVVVEQWHISEDELIDLLVNAKREIALFLVKRHLTFQGYAPEAADEFISSNMIKIHLSRDHELLKNWKNAEKIIKEVQKKKKSKVKG